MLGAIVFVQGAKATEAASVQRASAALKQVCSRVVVLGGAELPDADHRPLPRDVSELAAVAAALREAGEGHVAVFAADLRHPSSELLRYMAHVRGSFEVIAPQRRDGSLQPLAALYRTSLLRRAEGLLAAGERELSELLKLATLRPVSVEEVAKFGEPEDLLERSGPAPM